MTKLSEMTPSEVLQTSYDRLVSQGCFGYDYDSGMCRYLTEEGSGCAIGVLVEKYAKIAEKWELEFNP